MMREEIQLQERYPTDILAALTRSPNSKISIANRWILGWPQRVDQLIEHGTYLEALSKQADLESEAWVEAASRGQENLPPWEINELAGLDPAPPVQ